MADTLPSSPPAHSLPAAGNRRMRLSLLLLLLFGTSGALIELVLIGHFEDRAQWVPMVLLTIGLVLGGWLAVQPTSAWTVRALLAVAWLQVGGGILGIYFHLKSNIEFELEMNPNAETMDLAWDTLSGAMPALAPGAVTFLGLLGILVARQYRADINQP